MLRFQTLVKYEISFFLVGDILSTLHEDVSLEFKKVL